MSTPTRLKVCLFLAALATPAIVVSRAGDISEAAPSAAIQSQNEPNNAYAHSVSSCGPDWQIVPSPNAAPYSNILNGVVAVSSNDIWAVGYYTSDTRRITLIEHWDGSAWNIIPSPNRGWYNFLTGVSAVSSDNIWAVGSYSIYEEGTPDQTLIEHWNGSTWTVVASPNAGGSNNFLNAVDPVSSNDIWAVGSYYEVSTNRTETLVEHWNGSTWSLVPSPNASTLENRLGGVAVVASNDVWAVGTYAISSDERTLVEHWNGSTWSLVPSLNIGGYDTFNGVSVVASDDIWAVGYYIESGVHGLLEHWNGSTWSVIPNPNELGYDNYLYEVDAVSSSDVWAVGFDTSAGGHALIEHWNGSTWSVIPNPTEPGYGSYLYGVDAVSSSDVWAVGDHHFILDNQTLIERYNPCPPSPTPMVTQTPVPPRCPGELFTDVCPTDYFYPHVLDLNDLNILSGYNTVPPCDGPAHVPCFKPYNWTTRGQIAKIVSLAAGFNEPVSSQSFQDVPSTHTFYQYIERMAARLIIVGYACGGPGEPCGPANLPYFRPGNTVGRGQLCKMVAIAFDLYAPVSTQTFEDVPPGHTFYDYIELLAVRGIINGYDCGNPEPCVQPNNRPYFRPANPISRGQIAKIVNLVRLQPTPTPIAFPSSTDLPTFTSTPTTTETQPSTTETPTPTLTGTPTATTTHLTPSATPTCCTDVTGSIDGSCQPTPYTVNITINNSCFVTINSDIASYFEVSPNSTGPWQPLYVGDCFDCPIPPGTSKQTFSAYSGPLPEGNNWWRFSYDVTYYPSGCLRYLTLVTDPQPACVSATITPSPTLVFTTSTPTP